MPTADTTPELDVRPLRKPEKHPAIFAQYDALPVGGSFVLVNDHDPKHLRDEFETDHPGSYGWEYLSTERRDWRIQITKLASTPLPRVVVDTAAPRDEADQPDAASDAWHLTVRERDLDASIVALPPEGTIEAHTGPDVDVLVHVLDGGGTLMTERGEVDLRPGSLVWLPRRSERQITAGANGIRYLTVQQRRQMLLLNPLQLDR